MSRKNIAAKPESNRVIVFFFCDQLSNQLSEFIKRITPYYHIELVDLSQKGSAADNFHSSNWLRRNVEKINTFYENNNLNTEKKSAESIFISDDSVFLPFLMWIHDFAPVLKSIVLFSSNAQPYLYYSQEMKKIIYDAATLICPTMVIINRKNVIGRYFLKKISNTNVEFMTIGNAILTLTDNKKAKKFIDSSFNSSNYKDSFIDADKKGVTFEEKRQLIRPEKNIIKRIHWNTQRAFLRLAGLFSDGIKTGIVHGFDSGAMLDYIYRNTPQGKGPLGVIIDKLYLNSTPWKGVRYRENFVHHYLLTSIENILKNNRKVNIIDIAAGHAKYLFDIPENILNAVNSVILRDYDQYNCSSGKNIIKAKKLDTRIIYEQGDAFSVTDLASLPTDRTIAVASGFYELFDNNEMVIRSLKGVFDNLETGGILIYTNILWHPRHIYMARVLTRHDDKGAWLIRRRFQRELDELIQAVGFTKISQKVDPWGIFSVSLAQKKPLPTWRQIQGVPGSDGLQNDDDRIFGESYFAHGDLFRRNN